MDKREKEKNKVVADVVEKSKDKAEDYLQHPEKANQLLSDAIEKANSIKSRKGPLSEFWAYVYAFFRLLRSYINREYTTILWRSIVLVVVAIIYFVALVDLLPDFIPGIGYIDDAAVIAFVISQIRTDIDTYLQWEAKHDNQKQNE